MRIDDRAEEIYRIARQKKVAKKDILTQIEKQLFEVADDAGDRAGYTVSNWDD